MYHLRTSTCVGSPEKKRLQRLMEYGLDNDPCAMYLHVSRNHARQVYDNLTAQRVFAVRIEIKISLRKYRMFCMKAGNVT